MKKTLSNIILLAIVLVFVVGCSQAAATQTASPAPNGQITVPAFTIQIFAPGPNPTVNKADAYTRVSGVFMGVWHGIISPVTLIVSFINPNVQMYEVHNDGSPYNLGFLFGVAIVFLLLGVTAGSRRRR